MLILVTGNKFKKLEVEEIVGEEIDSKDLQLEEIQSMDVVAVAAAKARAAENKGYRHLIVDDSSLAIDSLGGLPGPFVTWFIQQIGIHGLATLAGSKVDVESAAIATTCIGYVDDRGDVFTFVGQIEGKVVNVPRGDSGFGFDNIFVPKGQSKTLAEMSAEEKSAFNPRRIALEKLADYLFKTPKQ